MAVARIRSMMCLVDLGNLAVPLARRAVAPGWRDPRLWIGLAIVAASVLAGALVLGSSDDTVPVWAASGHLSAGQVLTSADLAVRRVRFGDQTGAGLYLRADRQLPSGLRLSRDVGPGELVPKAAVGTTAAGAQTDLREVPVSVPPDQLPSGIESGDDVDVYIRPAAHTACDDSTVCDGRPALSQVSVLEAPVAHDTFGSDGSRTLVLAVSPAQARRFFALLANTDGATLTVVGRVAP
jgi:hypothetical protein